MVKLVILLVFLHFYSTVLASTGEEDFAERTERTSDSIAHILRAKEYPVAQILIENWLSDYSNLEIPKKEEYKHVEKNMYFLSACVLAEDGKTFRALSALNEAIVKGYRNYDQIMGDKHLKRLHGIREFTTITDKLRENTDYLSILKASGEYTYTSITAPSFLYSSIGNYGLAKFRNEYKLDSIAGNGNEQSRLIRVMNWVHNQVAHNGNRPIPNERDALSLLADQKKALDCRGLATILNEAYLALGYPSRITLCMPKDISDGETHVVVSVFSKTYSRWVMMDPTSDAYITGSNGQLLGLREIRESLINNTPIHLNKDANWNGKVKRTGDEYIYRYLAKNLYWFESPVVSTFGSETFLDEKQVDYIRLYPSDYKQEESNVSSYQYGTLFTTKDSDHFWQAPK